MADDVAPRLDALARPSPAKPPSGFWNAATKAAVLIRSAGDCARTAGANTTALAARLSKNRFI